MITSIQTVYFYRAIPSNCTNSQNGFIKSKKQEKGIMFNEDELIIDSNLKPIEIVWDYKTYVSNGFALFNLNISNKDVYSKKRISKSSIKISSIRK